MAFVVEDGTGLATATSYISEAFADAYHLDRGDTVWAALASPAKLAALVRATDYVDKRFGTMFRGFRESKSQALEWPRLSAFDNDHFLYSDVDKIPRNLQKAIAEYALISAQITLLPIPAPPFSTLDPVTNTVISNASGQVKSLREKVGPIEESRTFESSNSQVTKPGSSQSSVVSASNLPEYPVADEWIKELLKASGSRDLSRA